MSSKKIFIKDAASYLEAKIAGLDLTEDPRNSKVLVNPKSKSLVNKVVLLNLPVSINFDRLIKFNEVISRFPINCSRYRLKPYEVNKTTESRDDYSPLILTKELMTNPDKISEVVDGAFLLGTETEVEGYLTLIGVQVSNISNQFNNGQTDQKEK